MIGKVKKLGMPDCMDARGMEVWMYGNGSMDTTTTPTDKLNIDNYTTTTTTPTPATTKTSTSTTARLIMAQEGRTKIGK